MFSFFDAIKDDLKLGPGEEGQVWEYAFKGKPITTIHRHVELEVNLVVQGNASYLLEGCRYELGPNSLVWLFPDQNHILINQSPGFQIWIGVFKPELLHKLCTTPNTTPLVEANPPGNFCKHLDLGRSRRLAGLFREIEEARPDLARYNAGLGYLLLVAWDAHLSSNELLTSSIIHPMVKEAVELMQMESSVIGLQDLARKVGLSPSRLGRLFKRQTGLSFSEFQNNRCLSRFLQLYEPGQSCTMLEAALLAGFGSYPQFYRTFRRYTGYSPANYFRQRS